MADEARNLIQENEARAQQAQQAQQLAGQQEREDRDTNRQRERAQLEEDRKGAIKRFISGVRCRHR